MKKIAVIDYGMGNLHSVEKALQVAVQAGDGNYKICVTSDPQKLMTADRIVFPGVGALGYCIQGLQQRGLDEVLRLCIKQKPVLGICVGMQALFDSSEENGGTPGLGIIEGEVVRFVQPQTVSIKIPHMGWNEVRQTMNHPMWQGIDDMSRFYFVHSYYVRPVDKKIVVGDVNYGQPIAAVVAQDNIFAVQFHPEKSQQCGLKLLTNFLNWKI
ncbi:Imidazole glycerol phosphate synthase amidotransferase subunit [hydrothermal vent metagenome]|uniref:Imidazole glycerol phosphate synthase amidotransferase subunit n=1 Tax=hydrothermal vent metagenome TaxID=652676 RepID=A0A3B0ZN23_9ZZZZ